MATMDETLVALTRDRAAELAGLSQRQVDYWSRTGLVLPTVDARLSPQRPVRLYAYVELMSLMVAAELKSRGTSLQTIRKIVGRLRDRGVPQ
jgi:DNA-binding transcriptional MerR regulator